MPFPLVDLGGEGPLLHWAPANGFPLTTYQPLVDGLAEHWRSVSIPPRALWPDIGPPPGVPGSWEDLAVDLIAGLEAHRLAPVVGIGHSFGGVATLLAAASRPDLFRAVIVLDPTVLPAEQMRSLGVAKAAGWPAGHPMAVRARERRDRFADHDEAFDYWRDKRLFSDWPDEALRRYVTGMLMPAASGGLTLRWSAEWEAYYYESFHPDTWTDIAKLDSSLPILAVGGGASDTFLPAARASFQEAVPHATLDVVPGFGHLFPQAAPVPTLALMSGWLSNVFRGDAR